MLVPDSRRQNPVRPATPDTSQSRWGATASRSVRPSGRGLLAGSQSVSVRTTRAGKKHFAHCVQHARLGAKMSASAPAAWIPRVAGAAVTDEWPDPIPLVAKTPDSIGSDVLPGVLGEYAQALSEHTETPIDISILGVLAACSAALAGKIEVEAEPRYKEPVQIWVCGLLESGNRKTAVLDAVRKPLDDYEDSERVRLEPELKRLASERKTKLATIEKLRRNLSVDSPSELEQQRLHIADLEAELADEQHRITLTTADITPEAAEELMEQNGGRLAIFSDEAGMFDIMAGRYTSQPNVDVFLKGHTGGRVSTNRRSRRSFIPHAHLTICIFPQPGVIQGLKDKPFMRDRGLLARFLYVNPESPIGRRKLSPVAIPNDVRLGYETLITRLLHWRPECPVGLALTD